LSENNISNDDITKQIWTAEVSGNKIDHTSVHNIFPWPTNYSLNPHFSLWSRDPWEI